MSRKKRAKVALFGLQVKFFNESILLSLRGVVSKIEPRRSNLLNSSFPRKRESRLLRHHRFARIPRNDDNIKNLGPIGSRF